MTKLFQAALDTNANVGQNAGSPGQWIEVQGGLQALADGLKSNSELARDQIKSAPQVWGHVRIFETALLASSHVAHRSALAEWYGLLTAVALRSALGMSIRSAPVDLADAGNNETDRKLRTILRNQQPQRRLTLQADWSRIYLLKARGASGADHTIGMLSPTTLFVPARSFRGSGDLPQTWLRDGIKNPLQLADCPLTHDQLEVCNYFAEHLIKTLVALQGGDTSVSGPLINLLRSYQDGLKLKGSASRLAEPVEDRNAPQLASGAPAGSILAVFNTGFKEGTLNVSTSDCRIALPDHARMKEVFSAALLVDPRLPDTLQAPADQLVVLGTTRLSQVRSADDLAGFKRSALDLTWTEQAQGARQEAPGILVLTPNDIFSDHLVQVNDLNAAAAHPQGFENFILPIRPVALLFGDAAALREQMTIAADGDGIFFVRMTLSIRRRDNSVVRHVISRRYARPGLDRKDGDGWVVRGRQGLMVHPPRRLYAWPDFKSRDWRWNYLSSHGHDQENFRLTSGCSAEILSHDLRQVPTAERRVDRLSSWGSAQGRWPDVVHIESTGSQESPWMETLDTRHPVIGDVTNQDRARLQRCDFAFEAVCLSVTAGFFDDRFPDIVYAGIGLFGSARQPEMNEAPADIAIDFGTTNTTIYWKIANGKSQAVTFHPRLRHFNSVPDRSDLEQDLPQFFPAERASVQPFPTVVQETKFSLSGFNRTDLLGNWVGQIPPSWPEHAYLSEDLRALSGAIFDPGRQGQPHFNLKFSADGQMPKRIENFLGHLLLLTNAELIQKGISPGNVTWHLSYPLAVERPDAYQATLRKPLERLFPRPKVKFVTESDAALGYFLWRDVATANDALERQETYSGIILDIGGGTTDLYVYGKGPIWRQSMNLAGGDLMVRWLVRHPKALESLGLTKESSFALKSDGKYPDIANSDRIFLEPRDGHEFFHPANEVNLMSSERINAAGAIINSRLFGEAFSNGYHMVAGTDEFKRLEAGAALMLGGFLHYVSLQIRAMAESMAGNPERAGQIDFGGVLNDPELCFAGRGATYFRLKKDDPLFKKIINACLNVDPNQDQPTLGRNQRVEHSTHPKSEAVLGMLQMGSQELDGTLRQPSDERALGASLEVICEGSDPDTNLPRKKALTATSMVSELTSDRTIKGVADISLSEFKVFLERLASAGILFDISDAEGALKKDASQAVLRALRHGGAGQQIEKPNPPFIALLASTLDRLYTGDGVKYRFIR